MIRGPRPKPTAPRRADGNPGKRGYNRAEPVAPAGAIEPPPHLLARALAEWHRIAATLQDMGVVTLVDRAALAAYCQAWGRWVEAEEKLAGTPLLLKTPSGYIQQSPWLSVSNRQLELMGRYMAELGLTPASRSRVTALTQVAQVQEPVTKIELVMVCQGPNGERIERPMDGLVPALPWQEDAGPGSGRPAATPVSG
jgi:P27 family predicted phage terminase small subunit